jgi:hypothetical protein
VKQNPVLNGILHIASACATVWNKKKKEENIAINRSIQGLKNVFDKQAQIITFER